jgi:hypothetical protein
MSALCISFSAIAGVIASPAMANAAVQPGTPTAKSVVAAACSTAFTVDAIAPYSSMTGRTQGLLELRFNSCNRTIWGRISTSLPTGCVPSQTFCGDVTLHRNSDGARRYCSTAAGAKSCYTPALSDANVTSYAQGWVDYYAASYYARTVSY